MKSRFILHLIPVLTLALLWGAAPLAAETPAVKVCEPGKECGPCPGCYHTIDLPGHVDTKHEFHGNTMLKVVNLDPVQCSYQWGGESGFADGPNLGDVFGDTIPTLKNRGKNESESNQVEAEEKEEKVTPKPASELRFTVPDLQESSQESEPWRRFFNQAGGARPLSLEEGFQALETLGPLELEPATPSPLPRILHSMKNSLDNLAEDIDTALTTSRASSTALGTAVKTTKRYIAGHRQTHTPASIEEQQKAIRKALAVNPWTPQDRVSELRKSLEGFEESLVELRFRTEGSSATELSEILTLYRDSHDLIREMLEQLKVLDHGSDEYKEFANRQKTLKELHDQLESARLAPTEQLIHVRCGRPFAKTKTVKIHYTCTPRKAPSEVKADDPKPAKQELATVVCPSSLSITTGLGWSGLEEREFEFVGSFVPGEDGADPTLEEQVVATENSSGQVTPIILGHTRFWTGRHQAAHVSFGPILDFDDNTVELGFATGLSLSIRDNFFFTGGIAIGREKELAGGFELGDPKIGDLPAPPISEEWATTYFVGVSYKINQ